LELETAARVEIRIHYMQSAMTEVASSGFTSPELSQNRHPTKFLSDFAVHGNRERVVQPDWERHLMARKLYKCFTCGKIYEDEAAAMKCHDGPIQKLVENDKAGKPRFLGN
jgi:hypothetical protein